MKVSRKFKLKIKKLKKIDFKKVLRSKKFWFWFFITCLSLIVVGFLFIFLAMAWFAKDLPSPNKVARQEGYASRIYDRNGEVIYDVFKDAKRTPVKWEEIPENLKKATIAVEDKDFSLAILEPGDIYATHTRAHVETLEDVILMIMPTTKHVSAKSKQISLKKTLL